VTDERLVLEVNYDDVPVGHGDHQATSVRRPDDLLIGDVLLLYEVLFVDVREDAGDGG